MKDRRLTTDLADVWLGTEIASELKRMEADGFVTAGRNAVNEITWRLTATGQSAAAASAIEYWILAGATDNCDTVPTGTPNDLTASRNQLASLTAHLPTWPPGQVS
jgi:predicted MarR family transcription regulator